MMDILEKKLKKEVERMKKVEAGGKILDDNVKAIAERFAEELKLKGLDEALKPETVGIRSNRGSSDLFRSQSVCRGLRFSSGACEAVLSIQV